MQVDPEAERFSEIHDLEEDNEKFLFMAEEYKAKTGNDLVVAKSDSKEQLNKLQDDLRKAGYKKIT